MLEIIPTAADEFVVGFDHTMIYKAARTFSSRVEFDALVTPFVSRPMAAIAGELRGRRFIIASFRGQVDRRAGGELVIALHRPIHSYVRPLHRRSPRAAGPPICLPAHLPTNLLATDQIQLGDLITVDFDAGLGKLIFAREDQGALVHHEEEPAQETALVPVSVRAAGASRALARRATREAFR